MMPNFRQLTINPILKIQQFPFRMLISMKKPLILYPRFKTRQPVLPLSSVKDLGRSGRNSQNRQ